jgi:hypothetical protein
MISTFQRYEEIKMTTNPKQKLTIVGGGIIGAMEAYYAYLDAKAKGEQVRITIYERYPSQRESPTASIVPSLTIDEIMSVVPRGPVLDEKLGVPFYLPGGIRISDVAGVNDSPTAQRFISQVKDYSKDEVGHAARTQTLLELGRMSMDLWQEFYDNGDDELKKILKESNFNPCHEPRTDKLVLHEGYRIDLIYNIPDARRNAERMRADYISQGYASCKILSPAEVKAMDPFLADFCEQQSADETTWNNDAVALYRPGGCIDTERFLPKFYVYLQKLLGEYVNEEGKTKKCFQIKYDRNVNQVSFSDDDKTVINGLGFANNTAKHNKHAYEQSDYAFCPGEAVGTLTTLGFDEPAYAGFAGASLLFNIPIPADKLEQYKQFNHCMEVHQEGVVLAWQARFRDNKIYIGVAGTKAFYGDKKPHKDEEFATNRNLLQLNMVNDVLPEFISLALGRNTHGQKLDANDLRALEDARVVQRWAGTRAVAYDGFPTLGPLYNSAGEIQNAHCTTHLGSGGVSFALAVVAVSRCGIFGRARAPTPLVEKVLEYGNSKRSAVVPMR